MSKLRTGIDIVKIDRIENSINKHGEHFKERVFTPNEIDYCEGRARPEASYAARFAAKEAVMKLLGKGIWEIAFTDIEIINGENGRPAVILTGGAIVAATDIGVTDIDISMSHEKDHAIANAVAIVG